VAATARQKKPERKKVVRRPPPPPLGNQRALGNDGGRPTLYKPEYVEQARKLCQLGATDAELADFFKVSRSTLFEWRAAHPEFSDTLKIGKALADDRAERSFYQRAIGYDIDVKKRVVKTDEDDKVIETVVTETTVHIPGDVGAQKSWLCNRRPREWREKADVNLPPERKKTFAESRDELITFLTACGIKLDLEEPPVTPKRLRRLASPASQVLITKAPP
jgi:hypothetical protein